VILGLKFTSAAGINSFDASPFVVAAVAIAHKSVDEVGLGEFVKQLVAVINTQKDVVIPFEDSEAWHSLFFKLKKDPALEEGRPRFFKDLLFDWDGPYPKSRNLEVYLQSLHWNAGIDAKNPGYESIAVPPAVSSIWLSRVEQMPSPYKQFLDRAAKLAVSSFFSKDRA
jgi:hypothetical protein